MLRTKNGSGEFVMILMEVLEQYNKSFCSDGNVAYYGYFNLN